MSLSASVCLLLSEWVSFLLVAVPPRSRRTFVELLIGCMLNPEGWVTRAIGAIRREAHWTTYYKLIERAHVPVAELAIRLLQLVHRVFPAELANLIIDDTLVPRCAKSGPGISVKHDHSRKANRPTFLNSQCWVTLALVVKVRLGSALTIPIRSWLVEESGQRGKLWVARQLIDSVRGHVKEARLLIDAWFMRKSLILPLLEQQVRIIGQVRRDTALYLPPEPEPRRRGRKRKYGLRIDAAMLDVLPVTKMELTLYGKVQPVRVRTAIAVARFLKGVPVRAVWCQMIQTDNTWSRARLILATETDLSAQAVVEIYAERWGIEPLFHNLKRWWGVTNLWQQSKEALELWMQIRSTAYALTQLLALRLWKSFPLMEIAPWRKGAMITAGLFGQWMRIQFIGLPVRDAYDPKSGQFVMPFPGQDLRLQC
ncbi:MAG: transposase [Sterolibacteriaceae bacterium]|uniref:Transposase n=1 Tax=Candidatus Methylophosphatis roskildensis TaxID=2899263 RepID=A0A9D7E2Y5_9PROT|nr:transposase [Candidatus Methylophosphatis roskildensis]